MGTSVMIGELFDGRYRLERRIGSGGMADVYLATDESLGRQVAIKVLSDRYAQDDGFVERFRREASAAAGLNHQNIVAVYDRGEAEGTYYIAMEFLDGPTLKEEIVRRAPLPEAQAIGWATQALDALDFAHRRGVIHRDVKPHNMVLTEDGRLKVTDFGIARAQNTQQMTEVGSIVGTAQYLSPEQARGQAVGPQSDLYSMGIVLYEMLTGDLPFTGDGAVDIAMKQVSDAPPSLRERNRLVSPALEQVVMRALAKDPALRHPSARAMADELRRVGRGGMASADTQQATQVIAAYNHGQNTSATSVLTRPPAEAPPEPKRSALPWILVAILLAASAVIGYLVYNQLQGAGGVTVPDTLIGGSCQNAAAQLANVGLKGDCRHVPSTPAQKGHVFKTDPTGGSSVDSGSTVKLFFGNGPKNVTLPNLAGKRANDASTAITDLGLPAPHVVQVNSPKQPGGDVVSTQPGPGSIPADTVVTLKVATGNVVIPDVTGGLTCSQASQQLSALTLQPTCSQQNDNKVPAGQVIGVSGQSPGNRVPQGSAVTVLVSSGPGTATVPNVVGLPSDTARSQLKGDGFKVVFGHDVTCTKSLDGIVESQTPQGGTTAQYGSYVSIRVWQYTPSDPSCGNNGTTTTATT
ncbi:MAG: Stk1 family PASTA domain-containing Ser/Thr kinase [Gaiellales bacterium]